MESQRADMPTKWAESVSGLNRLLSGNPKYNKPDRDIYKRVARAEANGRACEHPISKDWALYDKLRWNSMAYRNKGAKLWQRWARVRCVRNLKMEVGICHAVIAKEKRSY